MGGTILHKKLMARLLVLVYLLTGVGLGNGLLWCQESEAFAHVEYNLAGKCQEGQDGCLPADERRADPGQSGLAPLAWSSSADCLDTPASRSLSHARTPAGKDLPDPPLADDWSAALFPPVGNLPATGLSGLNLATQPPPPQALAALRTVVLLN